MFTWGLLLGKTLCRKFNFQNLPAPTYHRYKISNRPPGDRQPEMTVKLRSRNYLANLPSPRASFLQYPPKLPQAPFPEPPQSIAKAFCINLEQSCYLVWSGTNRVPVSCIGTSSSRWSRQLLPINAYLTEPDHIQMNNEPFGETRLQKDAIDSQAM
jgi:hypothetical protein